MTTLDDNDFLTLLESLRQTDVIRDELLRRMETAWRNRDDMDGQITGLIARVAELRETLHAMQRRVKEHGDELQRLRDEG